MKPAGFLHIWGEIHLLQDGRDFADVVSPKLPLLLEMATKNRFFLHVIRHLVEGDTGVTC